MRLFALGHFSAETFLGETARLTVSFTETFLSGQLLDRVRVCTLELSGRVLKECSHVLTHRLHDQVPLILALFNCLVNIGHLHTIPLDFLLVIVTAILEQFAPSKHVCILLDQSVELDLSQVAHEVFGFSALFVENLVSVFFAPAHTLKLGQILSSGELLLNLGMLVLELSEGAFDVLDAQLPLFIEQVVLFEAGAYLTLVLLVMRGDLTLALLEDLDFEPTLARPLQSQVLLELLNRLILTLLAISDTLRLVVLFLGHQPREGGEETIGKDLDDASMRDDQISVDALGAIGVLGRLHFRLLDIIVGEEWRLGGLLILLFVFFAGIWGRGRIVRNLDGTLGDVFLWGWFSSLILCSCLVD